MVCTKALWFGIPGVLALLVISFDIYLSLCLNSLPLTGAQLSKPQCYPSQRSIAYFIQISDSNIQMLPRLLSVLGTWSDDILLHFDARINHTLIPQYYPSPSSARVSLLEPRQYLEWGKISLTENTRAAMRDMLNHSQCWTHFIAMAPSAYPLLSGSDFHRVLHSTRFLNASFGQFYDSKPLFWPDCDVEESLRLKNKAIKKGEGWFIWSRNVAEYLSGSGRQESGQKIGTEWSMKLSCIKAPDELFAQNVILDDRSQSSLRDEIRNDHMYYIVWPMKATKHPNILHNVTKYWNSLQMSGSMFARKFVSAIDAKELLDKIDLELHFSETQVHRVLSRMQSACILSQQNCVGNTTFIPYQYDVFTAYKEVG